MTFTTTTDAESALAAIRSQRAAASAALEHLELYRQLEPRAECLVDWKGSASAAYLGDVHALVLHLSAVRSTLRDAIDDLWVAIGEAGVD